MLRPPHTSYSRLHVYHLDLKDRPEINDPDLIGVWIEDDTSVLFFHRPKDELVADICLRKGCNITYQADLDYEDWESGQDISAFTVDNLTVAPVWETGPADIYLDPSVIFGSGFHPTTRACLQTLLHYLDTPEVAIRSMLDLGTGTGLLSIAAAFQGVGRVLSVDNNPLACEVAEKNMEGNKVDRQVTVQQLDLRHSLPETANFDLVIANLYQVLLKDLFQNPSFWQAKIYILSGFISSMEPNLLAALPQERIRFLERIKAENWRLWVLMTRDQSEINQHKHE